MNNWYQANESLPPEGSQCLTWDGEKVTVSVRDSSWFGGWKAEAKGYEYAPGVICWQHIVLPFYEIKYKSSLGGQVYERGESKKAQAGAEPAAMTVSDSENTKTPEFGEASR